MKQPFETKDYVTPYAFAVEPSLLGLPLAKPRKRLFALLLDLLIAAVISSLGGLAIGLLLIGGYLYSVYKKGAGTFRERLKGVKIRTVILLVLAALITAEFQNDSDDQDFGVKPAFNSQAGNQEIDWDTFAKQIETASKGDSLDIGLAIKTLESSVKLDSTDSGKEIVKLKKRVEELEAAREDAGIITSFKKILEDVGLSVGWIALYFVLFPTWTDGQTPAKRWLGIRVLKLNGKPLNWWNCFERFGGYSAGLATGLLGFAQIYWDSNRQTIHDKITETVVVDMKKKRLVTEGSV